MAKIYDMLGQIFKSEIPVVSEREQDVREEFRYTLFELIDGYLLQIDPSRKLRYDEVDEMDTRNPLIAKVLDIVSEESRPIDPKSGKAFKIVATDRQIERIGNELLDRIKLEDIIGDITRDLPKYGENIRKIVYITQSEAQQMGSGVYGVLSLEEIKDPVAINPVLEFGRLQAWNVGNSILPPWEFWHVALPGKSTMREKAPHSFHGRSWLEAARPIWRSLKISENSILMARVSGTVMQRVFKFPAEDVDPKDIPALINDYKRSMYRKHQITDEGEFFKRVNVFAYDENIYWPVLKGMDTGVETIGGNPDIRAIEDIKYWQNIMFASLGVPKEYLQFDRTAGGVFGKDISQEDIRFARSVKKIQRAIVQSLTTLMRVELSLRGIDPLETEFEVQTGIISFLEETQRAEALTLAIEVGQNMQVLGDQLGIDATRKWRHFVLESIASFVGPSIAVDELKELIDQKPEMVVGDSGINPLTEPNDPDADEADDGDDIASNLSISMARKTEARSRYGMMESKYHSKDFYNEYQLLPSPESEADFMEKFDFSEGLTLDMQDNETGDMKEVTVKLDENYVDIWVESTEEEEEEGPQLMIEGM